MIKSRIDKSVRNNDLILGAASDNIKTYNIAMISKWDVVDLGSSSLKINLNTPNGVRPTVQEAGQSGEQAHKIAYLSDFNGYATEELVVGDYVYVKTYDKNGTITKIKKDKYSVNIGQFTMDFTKKELIKAQKPQEKKKRETRLSGYNPSSHAALSLDLRGKRYEEVNYLMDQYLDQAILGNLETVSIIHGFGTGALRTAVHEYLKKQKNIEYRFGGPGEGGQGATIVILN